MGYVLCICVMFFKTPFHCPFNNATITGSPRENLGTTSGRAREVDAMYYVMFNVLCIVCVCMREAILVLLKFAVTLLTLWHFCNFLLNIKKIGLFLDNH